MKTFKLTPLFLAFALAPSAHASGVVAGATEFTQLANKAELIAQVGQAVQTTSNTLMTAQSTMQMLRQLPPGVVDEAMRGLPVEKVRAMADAYVVMSQATGVYRDAENVLRKAHRDAERLGITPSELLRAKAEAAAAHGGIYRQTYEAEQEKLRLLAQTSKEVQRQAETVQRIDSNVGGIQFLATQNVQMQATLATMAGSIAEANANAAMAAGRAEDERARAARREAEMLDARRRAEREAPPVSRLPLPHEFSKQKPQPAAF